MKFKVGDRVKVYNGGIFTGIVSFINDRNEPWLEIVCDEDKLVHGPFHFKQCRRLIKKTKLNNCKQPIYETDMLTDVYKGIHTVTTHYSDGTSETKQVPKGPVILPNKIWFSHFNSPEEFPKQKSINCFHPKIANFVLNVLKWLNNVGFK